MPEYVSQNHGRCVSDDNQLPPPPAVILIADMIHARRWTQIQNFRVTANEWKRPAYIRELTRIRRLSRIPA